MKNFFNPITVKRFRRFRANRRAWRSLIIMALMYAASLGSELICNDRPLLVKFEGGYYFPAFRFYPDNLFTGSGLFTRPDYKAIRASPAFKSRAGNYMIFPPIPFGPREHIDPAKVPAKESLRADITPEPAVGSVNMRPDFAVSQGQSAGRFFGVDDGLERGMNVLEQWEFPAELLDALEARFQNRAAPGLDIFCRKKSDPDAGAEVSVPAYSPRGAPPATVRLTFREKRDPRLELSGTVVFNADLSVRRDDAGIWPLLDENARGVIEAAAADFQGTASVSFGVNGVAHKASLVKTQTRFPHPPVRGHWLGIDDAGRDVLSRIVYGFRTSLTFGLILVAAALGLGAVIGAVQGYYGGGIDLVCQRLIEIWSALPFLYIMILLGAVYGRGFVLLLVVYGIFNWIGVSYYVRAEFLRLRRQAFVDAARCMGLSGRKIIFAHILPNALTPMLTLFPFLLVGAISSLAALDYLGFGLPPPTPSWGELLAQAQQVRWAWWLAVYPALALFVVILLGVFIGEGVRDAFDPKQFTRIE